MFVKQEQSLLLLSHYLEFAKITIDVYIYNNIIKDIINTVIILAKNKNNPCIKSIKSPHKNC